MLVPRLATVVLSFTLNMQTLAGLLLEWSSALFVLQEAETGFVPSVQDFDKKLSEADAYLQILIDQLKVCIFFNQSGGNITTMYRSLYMSM